MSLSELIKIAKATKTFGQNGELVLRLYDTFPEEINFKEPIFAVINGLTVPFFLSSFRKQGANKAVVVFDDIDTEYRAAELIGTEFVAPSEEYEDDDELYYEDLEGYAFTDEISGKKGTVTGYIDNDMNPILIAETEGKTIYIPANENIIKEVDPDNSKILVALPDGLLDLYL